MSWGSSETVAWTSTEAYTWTSLSFAVTASAGPYGSISPAGVTVVNRCGSVTYTIAANAFARITDVLVDGTSVGAVSSYTFSDVDTDHTIVASFADLSPYESLLLYLDNPQTTCCELWRVTRLDGAVYRFCTHSADVTYDGHTYYAARGGFASTSISTVSDFSSSNVELTGYLDAAGITASDLLSKLYDGAVLEISLINYLDTSLGEVLLTTGTLGEVTLEDGKFRVEVLGNKGVQSVVGDTIEKSCLAAFGDSRCGIDASLYTVSGSVTSVEYTHPRRKFYDLSRVEVENYYQYGSLTWTTGNNAGYQVEVVSNTLPFGLVELFEHLPHQIEIGDTYTITAGCDKNAETCKTKWASSNIVNFRGFGLYLPGRGGLLDYPDRS